MLPLTGFMGARNNKYIYWFLGVNACFLAVLFGLVFHLLDGVDEVNPSCNLDRMNERLLNKRFPQFDFVDLEGNVASSILNADRVLLIALRTDCGACQSEMKLISEHFEGVKDDIRFVGISSDSKQEILEFKNTYNIKFPILIDRKAEIFRNDRITCTPTNFILENRVVKKVHIGGYNDIEELKNSL